MKVLFIVQGEGRGHLTQALSLERMLTEAGHDVVEMLVGQSPSREVPQFFLDRVQTPLVFFDSPNFQPGRDGRHIGRMRSVVSNMLRSPMYMESMLLLRRRIKESGADLVVNFYEVLCGLTYALFRPGVPQVSIAHQYLFLHPDFQFPKKHKLSQRLLRSFTRATSWGATRRLALSLRPYDAELAGAGIVDSRFSLDRLLAFSHEYMEDVEFRQWENRAKRIVLEALEAVYAESRPDTTFTLSWRTPSRPAVPAFLRQWVGA